MFYPLTWPSWAKFYPMGISPAFSLTQDLSPEQCADILMLGCGDPRNILYTLSTDVTAPPAPRKLDITCCDLEPAVLARNIILFTLAEDDVPSNAIWDIFYHFKLSDHTSGVLANHARKLADLSETLETWSASNYGSFIKFVDRESLSELRRYWTLYAEFSHLPSHRLDILKKQQTAMSNEVLERLKSGVNVGASRSATVFWRDALQPVSDQFGQYWKNGTTATTNKDIQKLTTLNPTFCYSLHQGEAFDVYVDTFPQGFHFSPAFAPVEMDPVGSNVTSAMAKAKQQFKASCLALQASRKANALTLRFFVGDAMAFCKALDLCAKSGKPRTEVFTAPWRAAPIDLTEHLASSPAGPIAFDVVDTSLLVGLLGATNILLATQPLLKKQPASQAVMYMDIALPIDWATRNFLDRLGGDVPTIGLLIGLVPRAVASLFTSHSVTHEITLGRAPMYLERIAWIDPTSGDKHFHNTPNPTIQLHALDLARVMFSIYCDTFFWERVPPTDIPHLSPAEMKMHSSPHYDRSVMAALWAHARSRLQIGEGSWESSVAHFMGLVRKDRENWSTLTHIADLRLNFRLQGLPLPGSRAESSEKVPRLGPFEGWPDVPPVVCLVLTVPNNCLDILREDEDEHHSPRFVFNLKRDSNDHVDTFSSIHAVWGRCVPLEDSDSRFVIEEDPEGFRGQSDLVASCWMDSSILADPKLEISLALMFTPMAVARYGPRLSRQGRRTGPGLSLFTTDPNEKDYVRVLRERPMGLLQTQQSSVYVTTLPETPTSELQHQIKVKDHEETTCFNSMEIQLDLTSEPKRSVGTKATTTQIGPCTMQVDIGATTHIVKYPYPIHCAEVKVNVDKKVQRVYLTAPFLNPVESGGYPVDPFPLLLHANHSPWNIHHVFLDRMPKLSIRNPTNLRWLINHTAVQMSDRERFVQHCTQPSKRHPSDVLVNIKESLATLIKLYAGLQQASQTIFGLREPSSDIYLVICVGGLRLDLAAATVVLDAAVIPWSPETAKLLDSKISIHEVETQPKDVTAWKGLIAASVERCRTWSHGPNCEYRSTGDAPIPGRVEDSPLCSCGHGRGFESPGWKVPTWERLLPHSTRAAISPLFGVSYVESIMGPGMKLQNTKRPVSWEEPTNKCWMCERSGRMPIPCPKCKKAKYCSRDCQRKHKELEHKYVCRPQEII